MNIVDLEELVKEHRNNPVVMEIIKARVVNYIYNNYVDFKQCQTYRGYLPTKTGK